MTLPAIKKLKWVAGGWLERQYMEHMPLLHVTGETAGNVFGVRKVHDKWRAVHLPTGMHLGNFGTKVKARGFVECIAAFASIEFWASITEQPKHDTATPAVKTLMQQCAAAREVFLK